MCSKLESKDLIRIIIVLFTGFISLSVIGFQALLPILEREEIFASLCGSDENESNICKKQSLRYNLMFYTTVSVMNMFCMVWGGIIQFKGIRTSVLSGGLIMSISAFLFGFGNDWLCFCSYIGIGIGAFGVLFGCLAVPPQYPQIAGCLASMLTGTMDASAGVFYIFFVTNKYQNVSMQLLFNIFAAVIFVTTLLLHFYVFSPQFFGDGREPEAEKQNELEKGLIINDDDEDADAGEINTKNNVDSMANNNENEASTEQAFIFNPKATKFWLIVTWSAFYVTTKYFYIATLDQQLDWITGYNQANDVDKGQHVFSVILLCSGLFTVVTGPLIDKCGMKISLIVMGVTSLVTAILSIIKIYNLQFVTMALLVFNRFFYFALVPLLVVKVYGAQQMQMVLGIIMFLAACFNFISYALDYIAVDVANNFTGVNIALGTACCVLSIFLSFYLF